MKVGKGLEGVSLPVFNIFDLKICGKNVVAIFFTERNLFVFVLTSFFLNILWHFFLAKKSFLKKYIFAPEKTASFRAKERKYPCLEQQ